VVGHDRIHGYQAETKSVTVAYWQAGKAGHQEVVVGW
jgi:hypothetical protein